jgi:signal transduction histidine kinase
MIQLANGDLLAATLLGLVKIYKQANGNYIGNYFSDQPFLTSYATDVIETKSGFVYATMPGLGLYKLSPAFAGYSLLNIFLPGIDLRSVRVDEKNTGWLWVCSGKGLIHFNPQLNKSIVWDEKNGLSNSYVYGSLEDEKNNLWISTNGGLCYLNASTNHIDNYTFQDGLQSNEFNTQAFYKSSTNNFYFGGIRGFNWFKSSFINRQQFKPAAAITGFEINDSIFKKDSNYIFNRKVTVPYNRNYFNFHFAALEYTRPQANRVKYMLQGWDAGWIVSENRPVRYANLPPGKYTLRLKVSNSAGVWSDEEKVFLWIKAPLWKQPWFIVIIAFLLLMGIIYFTWLLSQVKAKRKLQLLEKQIAVQAERNRISADMHDEIGSGITHIALLSELVQAQRKSEYEIVKDLQTISVSARNLVQTMGEIIWALNPQNDTLENLLAYIREHSQQYFEPFKMQLSILFPDEVPLVKLTNEQRRNLYLVTKELLHNAMKHSAATNVELQIVFNKNRCSFTVADNGIGMDVNNVKPHRNGISNLKKRMADIGGSIEWLPANQGTLVLYCFAVK